MLNNHEIELVTEISDFNTCTLIAAAYTVYENLCAKKPISKREFYQEFGDNLQSFKELFDNDTK